MTQQKITGTSYRTFTRIIIGNEVDGIINILSILKESSQTILLTIQIPYIMRIALYII